MTPKNPVERAKEAAGKIKDRAAELLSPTAPGTPGSAPPSLEEPTQPREPLPPKADQTAPQARTATGEAARSASRRQQGAHLTTAGGVRLRDTDHSLRAGERGPTLLQDHHLREKITRFDHERIPERVVHARGSGAHGIFTGYGTASGVTSAAFRREAVETPVFVRLGRGHGGARPQRDLRGRSRRGQRGRRSHGPRRGDRAAGLHRAWERFPASLA